MKKIRSGASIDFLLMVCVRIVSAVAGVITTAILSRTYSLTVYGTYSQALVIISLSSSLALLALMDATNYFYNKADTTIEKEEYTNTIFAIEGTLGLIAAVIIILGKQYIASYFNNQSILPLIYVIALRPIIDNSIALFQILYVSNGKAKIIALRTFLFSVLKLLAVVAMSKNNANIVLLFGVMLGLDTLSILYLYFRFASVNFPINVFKANRQQVTEVCKYTLPMAVYTISKSLSKNFGKIVISKYMTIEDVAIFSNCSKELPFYLIVASLSTVLIPYFTVFLRSKDYARCKKLFLLYLKIGFVSTVITATASLIVPGEMISVLYSPEYVSGKWVFLIYALLDMIQFGNMSLLLSASGETIRLMVYAAGTTVINYALNYLFFWMFGMIGPAIATLATTILLTSLLLSRGLNIVSANFKELIGSNDLFLFTCKTIAITGVVYTIITFLRNANHSEYFILLAAFALFVVASLFINLKLLKVMIVELNGYRVEKKNNSH